MTEQYKFSMEALRWFVANRLYDRAAKLEAAPYLVQLFRDAQGRLPNA